MPWRTKFNHQGCSFTHKVQGFPSEVNDSYVYIYTFMQNLFLKILTHLVLSVTSYDCFPSGQICFTMNETEESDSIYTSICTK